MEDSIGCLRQGRGGEGERGRGGEERGEERERGESREGKGRGAESVERGRRGGSQLDD